jgi:hypothetical protein
LNPTETKRLAAVSGSVPGGFSPSMTVLTSTHSRNSSQMPKPGGTATGRRRHSCTAIGTARTNTMSVPMPSAHHRG